MIEGLTKGIFEIMLLQNLIEGRTYSKIDNLPEFIQFHADFISISSFL